MFFVLFKEEVIAVIVVGVGRMLLLPFKALAMGSCP